MNKYSYNGLKRVSKTTAKKLYMKGETILVCACNLRPENTWVPSMPFSVHLYNDEYSGKYYNVDSTFEKRMNAFTYYNCNHYCGYYPAYYVKEGGMN